MEMMERRRDWTKRKKGRVRSKGRGTLRDVPNSDPEPELRDKFIVIVIHLLGYIPKLRVISCSMRNLRSE